MQNKIEISATIVLYKEEKETVLKTIESFLKIALTKKLYLIDNSPTKILQKYFNSPEIEYIFTGKNLGFGKAHNIVLNKIKEVSKFHLILNPDVVFEPNIVADLMKELDNNAEVALISPKVVYPNGDLQYTCRKYPSFFDLISRRLGVFKNTNKENEYRGLDLEKSFFPDLIHGCFMLFKTIDFIKIKGFDERYFLYMEDVDICKKIDAINKKKMYFPSIEIVHIHRKGSAKKNKIIILSHFISYKIFFKVGF